MKPLTQDNLINLAIPFIVAILATVGYFWKKQTEPVINNTNPTVTQTTSGDSSPAVSGTQGNVIINIKSPPTEK